MTHQTRDGAAVAVALSGGGHRATVWALGALLYLVDAGKNGDVTGIASVSGGSIANGYVAHQTQFDAVSPTEFRGQIAPLLRHVAHDGLFAFGPATNLYLSGTLAAGVALGVAALVWLIAVGAAILDLAGVFEALGWTAPSWLVRPGWLGWHTLGLLAGAALVAVLLARRSVVVDRALAKEHFSRGGRPTLLADLEGSVSHVFCATELQSGDHLYFSRDFVSGYQFGVGEPGPVTLATAVQSSACLPGAFRPRRLPLRAHGFRPFRGVDPADGNAMVLTDGGVYDNMADQWHQGFSKRTERWPELAAVEREPGELIVVNASGGWGWKRARRWGLVIGEFVGLLRAKSVMYDATTAHRRSGLVGRFDRAELQGQGLRGALVHIPQSPWKVAQRWSKASGPWEKRAARAREVIAGLKGGPMTAAQWEEQAGVSESVPTTLGALGEDTTVRLLHHAYVLAMCNLHVILDYPLLEIPPVDAFRPLVIRADTEFEAREDRAEEAADER